MSPGKLRNFLLRLPVTLPVGDDAKHGRRPPRGGVGPYHLESWWIEHVKAGMTMPCHEDVVSHVYEAPFELLEACGRQIAK